MHINFFVLLMLLVAVAITFYFVGRNNPNIKAVNKLLAAGKIVTDTTGKVISIIKKTA
jgi:hypothetical protein